MAPVIVMLLDHVLYYPIIITVASLLMLYLVKVELILTTIYIYIVTIYPLTIYHSLSVFCVKF